MSITKYILSIIALLLMSSSFYAQKEKKLLSAKKLFKEPVYLVLTGDFARGDIKKRYGQIYKPKLLKDSKNTNKVYKLLILLDSDRSIKLDTFPIDPKDYPNVQEIIIAGDFLSFPNEIFEFRKLQNLICNGLCGDDICEGVLNFNFPDELFQLKHLKKLYLRTDAEIHYIPEKFNQLKKLEYLFISGHEFVFLPLNVTELPHLKHFGVNQNDDFRRIKFEAESNYYKQYKLEFKKGEPYGWEAMLEIFNKNEVSNKKNELSDVGNQNYSSDYKSGQQQVEGQLLNGKPNGKWTFYYENGKVKLERYYDKGVEIGTWTAYDTLSYKTKEYIFTPQEDKVVIRFYGKLKTNYNYKKKVYESITPYLRREIILINGKAEGDWKLFKIDRTISETDLSISEIKHYSNDKLVKKTTLWKSQSNICHVAHYKDGVMQGTFIIWINWQKKDQRKLSEGTYKNGKLEGKSITYNKQGEIIKEEFYKNGNLVKQE